jgi:membrane-bound lytic murein transglycosylase D
VPARAVFLLAVGGAAVAAVVAWDGGSPAAETGATPVADVQPTVELPMEMNARVEKWMRRFRTDQKRTFERFLARESLYADLIRTQLRNRGMPEDLLYLAMIESGFSARATSRASAVGVWQFMGPTAKQYGLRVDRWVDERRDPVKATGAALDYLEWLHDRYDSWYLAAAAFNAGPGRVDRVLRRHAGGRKGDEAVYWEIIDHLPRETREYVPKLLAAATLARQAARFGFDVKPVGAYEFDRVWVPGGTSLSTVAASLEIPIDLMRDLNPHLVRGSTPPGASYALRIPVGTSSQVIASLGGRSRTKVADD